MTKVEYKEIVEMVRQGKNKNETDLSIFLGFGFTDYEARAVSKEAMADLISYQCKTLNGSFDQSALNAIWQNRKKFIII